ncbi:hypothetical protein SRHO_G00199240 [Serrasalmus rhombeus]
MLAILNTANQKGQWRIEITSVGQSIVRLLITPHMCYGVWRARAAHSLSVAQEPQRAAVTIVPLAALCLCEQNLKSARTEDGGLFPYLHLTREPSRYLSPEWLQQVVEVVSPQESLIVLHPPQGELGEKDCWCV